MNSWFFSSCTSLSFICIPASVESICDQAFECCQALIDVSFEPDSLLRQIGCLAFLWCPSLCSFHFPAPLSAIDGSFFTSSRDVAFTIDAENEHFQIWDDYIFDFSGDTIVRYIGHEAFVTVDDEVQILGPRCFSYCYCTSAVFFPPWSKCHEICEGAFEHSRLLMSVSIPASVSRLGVGCFAFCGYLRDVTFAPDSRLEAIPQEAFEKCMTLKSIVVPASVKALGDRCFYSCHCLEAVLFASQARLASIGGEAFRECWYLVSITLPSSVTVIGKLSFDGCSRLTTVAFERESQLARIEAGAFHNCSKLTSISLPQSVGFVSIDPVARGRPVGEPLMLLKFESAESLARVLQAGGIGMNQLATWFVVAVPAKEAKTGFGGYVSQPIDGCAEFVRLVKPTTGWFW
jgi:hypothetical protein